MVKTPAEGRAVVWETGTSYRSGNEAAMMFLLSVRDRLVEALDVFLQPVPVWLE